MPIAAVSENADPRLLETIRRHWGYDALRPLQAEAMTAFLDGRDSLLVLPTGGGKSLCFQAPAVVLGGTTIVVSPLISLMKDQVDALRQNGVAADAINSSLVPEESRRIAAELRAGQTTLLYVSPERLALPAFRDFLRNLGIARFAIDEAHCISHWGHDFRPDYRQLSQLRAEFPGASIHAFTATATEQVRRDIAAQLRLREPEILVGDFDRPNLAYRVVRREDCFAQVMEVLDRHRTGRPGGEAGIIYAIRRRDVDELVLQLRAAGIKALPYHAGLSPAARRETQDAFSSEQCDLVVATVAFGMGIDRSNVRFVLHIGMPKSIEHYQQETGRAGRDGLEAELVLLYSGSDAMLWRNLMERSVAEGDGPVDPEYLRASKKHLDAMERFCQPTRCRHRTLVEYFGQQYSKANCGACDVCLGDLEIVPDGQTIARKILSCVARVEQRFGARHVSLVLAGSMEETVTRRGHDRLSTHGLLRDCDSRQIGRWIDQLLDQEVLVKETDDEGNYATLKLNEASWEVMRDQRQVRLVADAPARRRKGRKERERTAADRKHSRSVADVEQWAGVDPGLFEALRVVRRELAAALSVPPFVVFSDATLRELARRRPGAIEGLRQIHGIGQAKMTQYGQAIWTALDDYCQKERLTRDVDLAAEQNSQQALAASAEERQSGTKRQAFDLFRDGAKLDDVVLATGRAYSTVSNYLCEFIERERPGSIDAWVAPDVQRRVLDAAESVGREYLKPIFERLEGAVAYEAIRVVLSHHRAIEG